MSGRVDQILAGFADGDAISHEAMQIREILRAQGIESEIYANLRHTSTTMLGECSDADTYSPGDLLIHHYSIASPVVDQFLAVPVRKALVYHNITPASYFKGYDTQLTQQLAHAREHIFEIGRSVNSIWADSEFNASELRALGLSNTRVFPLLFDAGRLDLPDEPVVLNRLSGPLTTFLTVSRIVPNKRIETLIKAFYYYHMNYNPFSRLVIVGSGRSCPRYYDLLQMMVHDLDLPNVCFEGFAAPKSLPTYYRCADLFVSTSEHEGYCLPLLEAMFHGTIVLAHNVGGMPEAMGSAGVMYNNLDAAGIAVLMDMLISEKDVRKEVRISQERRISEVKRRKSGDELMKLVHQALSSPLK